MVAAKVRTDLSALYTNFYNRGGAVTVLKGRKALPKSLRYTPVTVNFKNDAPGYNPLRAAWGK